MNYDLSKIRIKCAEIVGWVRGYTGVTQWVNDPNGIRMGWSTIREVADDSLPNYPESADAALELVEWLNKKDIGAIITIKIGGTVCRVEIITAETTQVFSSADDTFPLAVCLAFLKANNIKPETLLASTPAPVHSDTERLETLAEALDNYDDTNANGR